jgi:REP element-mobilizing transposase RayT
VTQRGNRREAIFFEEGGQAIYLDLLAEQADKHEVQVWAYCVMPNYVHLILVPAHAEALGLAVGETHRRFTNFINARGRWSGHLFQSRFASVVLDDDNFVRAKTYRPTRSGRRPRSEVNVDRQLNLLKQVSCPPVPLRPRPLNMTRSWHTETYLPGVKPSRCQPAQYRQSINLTAHSHEPKYAQ